MITLNQGLHVQSGRRIGARIRTEKLEDMLGVVEDLKRSGENADKYIPGWEKLVQDEMQHIRTLAAEKSNYNDAGAILDLEARLQKRLEWAKTAKKPEKSWLEKAALAVKGGVGAVAGIFIEAGKQVIDLGQIALHFASFGKYEPKFKSDMAAAAEQGKGTLELLKDMAVGVLETPSRFLKALENDDWEAIGREAVNIYLLAKTIKSAPEQLRGIKNLTVALADVQRGLSIFRAKKVAVQLQYESRMLPLPKEPSILKPPMTGEPTILKPPPKPTPTVEPPKAPPKRTGGGEDIAEGAFKGDKGSKGGADKPSKRSTAREMEEAAAQDKELVSSKGSKKKKGAKNDKSAPEKKAWEFNPKVDYYVRTYDQAVARAFELARQLPDGGQIPLADFVATKTGKTALGKTITVEWRVLNGPGRGARVGVDDPTIVPTVEGPQAPHVGYQTAGKPTTVGHIFPEEGVMASRARLSDYKPKK
jgi:hypothetical protein